MDDRDRLPEAVLIAGPTASGKSDLATSLAERIGGAVVNADSMQLHAGLRSVTARPGVADEARVPHHLYGCVSPGEPASAAAYLERVEALLPELRRQGSIPVFVGGTGLYINALERGLAPVPPIAETVRAEVRRLDAPSLAAALAVEDPDIASTLRATDTQRLGRALEVRRSTGRSLLEWQRESEPGPLAGLRLERICLLPDRAWLHERIARRAASIVDDPAAQAEVRALKAVDQQLETPPAKAIGVAELDALGTGEVSREEAVRRLTVATRRYAKRQYTWFNNSLGDGWRIIRPPRDDPAQLR